VADRRLLNLCTSNIPSSRAYAGAMDWNCRGGSDAGALGSLPCAMLNPRQVLEQVGQTSPRTQNPIQSQTLLSSAANDGQRARSGVARQPLPLLPELVSIRTRRLSRPIARRSRGQCEVVVELKPPIVSFPFGFAASAVGRRVKAEAA